MQFLVFSFLSLALGSLLLVSCSACSKLPWESDSKTQQMAELPEWNCKSFRASLPPDFQSGFIQVPLSNDEPDTKLQIFYYGRWKPEQKPLILINGGPGGASWSFSQSLYPELNRRNIPFLFFDQRGTGCSSPPPPQREETLIAYKDYGSRGQAMDIEELRTQLNLGDQMNLFGHSYGSKVALRYLTFEPQHVSKLVFYGDYEVPDEKGAILEIQTIQKKAVAFIKTRLQANPEFDEALKTINDRIDDDLCLQDEKKIISVCGFDLIQMIGSDYSQTNFTETEKALIALAKDEDIDLPDIRKLIDDGSWWLISPRNLALTHLEYREEIEGKDLCDWATDPELKEWQFNPCWFGGIRNRFNNGYTLARDFLEPTQVEAAAGLTPGRIFEFYSFSDEENFVTVDHTPYRNWKRIELPNAGHSSFGNYEEFWKVLEEMNFKK